VRRFFEKVEIEKLGFLGMKDPASPVFGFSRETFEILSEDLTKPRRWFYGSTIFSAAKRKNLHIHEIPLLWNTTKDSRFSWWQALS
jgi:hypothetical protein